MKICLCLSCMDVKGGGPARSVPALAKSLALRGIDVTLLTFASKTNNLHTLEGSGVNVVEIEDEKEIKQVIANNFDLVHTQGLWVPFYHKVTNAARSLNIPVIVTPRGTLEPHCLASKKWKKKLAMALYQRRDLDFATCLLATAQMEAGNFRKIGLKNPIAVIPNGIEISDYPLRENVAIKKQVVFISRIDPKKGIPILIEAWKNISKEFPDWNLVIAGNGDEGYINSLKQDIINKGVGQSAAIVPPVFGEEKYKLYTESALFVLPTYSENFGMVIAEAMSCGLPVITTTGTPWEILNQSGAGWWIEQSVENLEKTMRTAMSMSIEELAAKGSIGSKIIRDNFTNSGVAVKVAELYSWLLGHSKIKPEFMFE